MISSHRILYCSISKPSGVGDLLIVREKLDLSYQPTDTWWLAQSIINSFASTQLSYRNEKVRNWVPIGRAILSMVHIGRLGWFWRSVESFASHFCLSLHDVVIVLKPYRLALRRRNSVPSCRWYYVKVKARWSQQAAAASLLKRHENADQRM